MNVETSRPDSPSFAVRSPGGICFDAAFGIICPWLCVLFDPAIFVEHGFLSGWKVYAYTEIALGTVALAATLACRRGSVLRSGVLAGTGIFAFLLGVVMLPVSMVAMFGTAQFIGVFGFAPFVCGMVLLSNAIRSARGLEHFAARIVLIAVATLVLPVIPDFVVHLMSGAAPVGS